MGSCPRSLLLLAAMLLAPPAHATTGSLTDTTVADFNAGGPSTDTYVAETDDGEVMLTPTAGAEFYGSAMPAGWSSTPLESEGAAIVQDGALQADGARVAADLAYEPGRSLEFVATFGADPSQSAGFGDFSAPEGPVDDVQHAGHEHGPLRPHERRNRASLDTLIPGSFLGAPHRYRIDWNLASVDFFVDGALVAVHPASPASSMPPFAADEQLGGESIALDWLRISPVPRHRQLPVKGAGRGAAGRLGGALLDAREPRRHGGLRGRPHRRHAEHRTGPGPRLPRSLSRATPSGQLPLHPVSRRPHVERSRTDPGP